MATPLASPDWLAQHLDDPRVRLLEVSKLREGRAYRNGHVPGAVFSYWKDLCWHDSDRELVSPDALAKRLGALGVGPASTLVLYGDPVQCGTYAFWSLSMGGHADVRLLDGGRARWVNEGGPLSKEVPRPAPVPYPTPAEGDVSMRVGRDHVRSRLGQPDMVLVDARTPEEYLGERVAPRPGPDCGAERRGRIPGARHLYFRELLHEDDTFRTPAQLRAAFDQAGATADVPEIIAYCRLGHRASLLWVAARFLLGYRNFRIYDGSWTEWGSIVGFPVEK